MKRNVIFSLFLIIIAAALVPLNGAAQSPMPSEVGDRLVDIKKCIDYLEKTGNLVRVKSEVDPKFELGVASPRSMRVKSAFFLKR